MNSPPEGSGTKSTGVLEMDASSSTEPIQNPVWDTEYYISDGNTVIQVENTLFKVKHIVSVSEPTKPN